MVLGAQVHSVSCRSKRNLLLPNAAPALMYQYLKELVKTFLPNHRLFALEPAFRSVLYQLYRGSRYHCSVCRKELRAFVPLPTGDLLCPACGSLPRGRRLWLLLSQEFLRPEAVILDFSPSRSLYRVLKSRPQLHYFSTDISGDFMADLRYDITQITAAAESYDVITCYHILEHVEQDRQAMRELYRVLKPGGTCLVQTPFRPGTIYENPAVQTAADRLRHFGQEDHVRVYSVAGLRERLIECGFHVEVREYEEAPKNRLGLHQHETVLVCTK